MEVCKTTGKRDLDEEINRILARLSTAESNLNTLNQPKLTGTPLVVGPAPDIMPAQSVTDVESSDVIGVDFSYAREDHAHKGVHSISVNGGAEQFGDVTISTSGGGTPYNAGTAGASVTVDWSKGSNQYLQLVSTTSTAITFANEVPGQIYVLEILQPASGSALVTWPTNVHFGSAGAPMLNTSQKADMIVLYYNPNAFVLVAFTSDYIW